MLKRFLIAAALTGLVAGPALAGHTITVSWTGKVASGTDDFGTFGATGADMAGVGFSSSYTFMVTPAEYQLGTAFFPDENLVYPLFANYNGAMVSATFTLNGQTVSFGGSGYSDLGARSDPQQRFGTSNQSQFETDIADFSGNMVMALFQRIGLDGATAPWSDLNFGDYDGDVSDANSEASSNLFALGDTNTMQFEQWALANEHLTIVNTITPDAPSPTPEPASWAMMIAGFGLVGATMRRKRTTVRFA